MNRILRFFTIAVAFCGLLALAPAAAAAEQFLSANGFGVITQIVAPGETTCPGGPCDGTRPIHVRGQQFAMASSFDGPGAYLLAPDWLITMNCNFDAKMAGPCWGSFESSGAQPGERWIGVWAGLIDFGSLTGGYKATGHGVGGRIEGLTFTFEAVLPGDQPYPYVLSSVRIVMPGRD